MRRKMLGCLFIAFASVLMSGCFLQFTLALRTAQTLSQEIELIIDAIRTGASTAVCQTDPFFSPNFRRCTYFINGVEVASTVDLLTELGPVGVIIDPMILEVPAGATLTGTFSGGGLNGNLLIYPNLSHVPIDDTRTLTPATGKQLVIVDLPATAPINGVNYEFALEMKQILPKGSGPTQVRGVMAGRVSFGGKTYYPPLLPCVSSMTAAPIIQLATNASLQPVTFSGALTPCNNATYSFFRAPRACDLDNDSDVDSADVNLIMKMRNKPAAAGDPRDVNGDASINANDARFCTLRCTRARCAA